MIKKKKKKTQFVDYKGLIQKFKTRKIVYHKSYDFLLSCEFIDSRSALHDKHRLK